MKKTIVITGATKGIGRAIADLFATEGGWEIAICARNADDLAKARAALAALHPDNDIHTHVADMSDRGQVLAFAEYINKELGDVDVLVNNAGIFIPGKISEEEEGALEKMINTNLYSAYHFTRALLPRMKARGAGHIFNMCSIASEIAYPNGGSYSISKFALLGFSKVLREEMKPHGIKVTAILPGATWSASWEGVDLPRSRLMPAADIARMLKAAYELGPSTVMEAIVLRPQLGDL